MSCKRLLLLLVLFVLVCPVQVKADIYRYIDETGTAYFTDYPRHDGFKVYLRERPGKTFQISRGYYPYRSLVLEASTIYELEEPLLRAVIEIESDYNRYAISSAGARGLMQLMPETMDYLGVKNPWDPKQNVMAGARYLKGLMKRFSGDLPLALAAYNAGSSSVIRYGSIPPFPQTERYVKKVMRRYHVYSGRGD